MDKKTKFYWLWAAIGLLLCLNIGTFGWVISKLKGIRASRPNTEEIMIRRLDFTPRQVAQYRKSRSRMQTQIKPCEDSLQVLRTRLLSQINQATTSDTTVSQVLAAMARQNTEIARLRFRHWQRVRALGTPDQQAKFDALMTRLEQELTKPGQGVGLRQRLQNRF